MGDEKKKKWSEMTEEEQEELPDSEALQSWYSEIAEEGSE